MNPGRKKDILFYSIIFVLIASMLALLFWLRSAGTQSEEQVLAANSELKEKLGEGGTAIISATIEGAVINPGTYYLNEGSNVGDLVDLAGGYRSDAEQNTLEEEALLTDGQNIRVEKKESNAAEQEDPDGKLDINSATASQLDELPGIGVTLAARIVSYRDQYGKFTRIEEIMNVPGIGETRYESLKDYIKAE